MFCYSNIIWNSPYFNFLCHSIWSAHMGSAGTLLWQFILVLPEYCTFSKVVIQYQYKGFSIVLQYKTARLGHPWIGSSYLPFGFGLVGVKNEYIYLTTTVLLIFSWFLCSLCDPKKMYKREVITKFGNPGLKMWPRIIKKCILLKSSQNSTKIP